MTTPFYAMLKGTAMKDKKKRAAGGGGGGPASVSVATTASGNYDNAVKIAIYNSSNNTFNFSNGVKDGSASTFGTASSPTRTTQVVSIPASDYLNGWNVSGTGAGIIVIGGYIRNNNFTSANKYSWLVASNTIQSQSFATGVTATVFQTTGTRTAFQDNTGMVAASSAYGVYTNFNVASGGLYAIVLQHAAGRGAATLPQPGDNVTFRIEVSDMDGVGTTYTAVHDVTINFT